MRSNLARIGFLALLAAIAVILLIVLSGGDDGDGDGSTTTTGGGTSAPEVIEIQGGAPVGGVRELEYDEGDTIRLEVVPEPGDVEIHVHGYDLEKETDGTKPVSFSFSADIPGGFEVEAHTANGEFQIAELTVNP